MLGRARRAGMMIRSTIIGLLGTTYLASASVQAASALTDVKAGFAEALGVEPYSAGIILSAAIISALLLMLAIAKQKPLTISIGVIVCVGALTVIGWMPVWIMILIILLVASQFAGAIAKGVRG